MPASQERHKCRYTTEVVCTLISVKTAADSSSLTGRTTALLWQPLAGHWRGGEGGTAGAVLAAALAALDEQSFRRPIPSPLRDEVEALAGAGSALNDAVRQRYVHGPGAGAIVAAAHSVSAAAGRLGVGQPQGTDLALCRGKCDRVVFLRLDPRLQAAMHDAARFNGMSFGAWIRDGVAAMVGEHQARRASQETRDGRAVAGRVAGLLVQAAVVVEDGAEAEAVAGAEDGLAGAVARLSRWGSRR